LNALKRSPHSPSCTLEVGLARDVRAGQPNLACVGSAHSGHDVEQSGLAGAVGADDADDLSAVGRERHVVERGDAAKAHGDAVHAQLG
jgi:hypothetical protein